MLTQTLQASIAGTVVRRQDPEYETVRQALIWNARKPDRTPELIVQVADVDDVIAAVKFARVKGMKIVVRGSGHHWCAPVLRDDSMLLDLARLNRVEIDPEARVATVQPVVYSRDFARQLAEVGLAFPVGHCPSVPLSGFLLGGGLGWNAGAWGVSCFSLLSVEIVTAEGRLVTASDTENPDLFWAVRGGGPGFFGVVTQYRLRLYSLPKAITTSKLTFPLEQLPAVVRWVAEIAPTLPSHVECTLLLANTPSPVAAQGEKVCILSATAFADTEAEAAGALSAFAHCPLAHCLRQDLQVSTPFEVLFEGMDRLYPQGRRYAVDTLWSASSPEEVLTIAQRHFVSAPSRDSLILASILPPPPPGALPLPDAAFSMVAPVFLACYAIWEAADQDSANTDWVRNLMTALEPLSVGHYLGEADIIAHPSRLTHAFSRSHWERLRTLGRQYDPDGIFDHFG